MDPADRIIERLLKTEERKEEKQKAGKEDNTIIKRSD